MSTFLKKEIVILVRLFLTYHICTCAYSEPLLKSKIERFVKTINDWRLCHTALKRRSKQDQQKRFFSHYWMPLLKSNFVKEAGKYFTQQRFLNALLILTSCSLSILISSSLVLLNKDIGSILQASNNSDAEYQQPKKRRSFPLLWEFFQKRCLSGTTFRVMIVDFWQHYNELTTTSGEINKMQLFKALFILSLYKFPITIKCW